jgi:DNA mismatch repair protein MutS
MRQYRQIKEKNADKILLFRLGDFYETFGDDAILTAKACGITLTKRNNGAAGDIPLAGFPYHQLDSYLPKLVKAGHRVAVCEQLEDPKQAKGIVRRGVVETVTPGVVLYDKLLDASTNTFAACIMPPTGKSEVWGMAVIDVSTATFIAGSVPTTGLSAILESFHPAEVIVDRSKKGAWESHLSKLPFTPSVSMIDEWHFDVEFATTTLLRQFGTTSLKGFGLDDDDPGICAAGALLHYVSETQRGGLGHITSMSQLRTSEMMVLDTSTRRNLEIHASQGGSAVGALVSILDRTKSPMGGRLLRWWMQAPLVDKERIDRRLTVVRDLVEREGALRQLQSGLAGVGDLERLVMKVMTDRATARDLAAMRSGLLVLQDIKEALANCSATSIRSIGERLDLHMNVVEQLAAALPDDPPVHVGTGKMFRRGYHEELDRHCRALTEGKDWIKQYQDEERQASGIQTLKVAMNNVFGYYIEVGKVHASKVPDTYERKQTLANSERYTTTRLKELEHTLVNAEGRVQELEGQLLAELRSSIAQHGSAIQHTASIIAQLDCLCGFADAAIAYEYVEPEVHDGTELLLEGARHPVIERLLPPGTRFEPNSLHLDTEQRQVLVITGPNMSGKSSYLRQAGLIVFLAHCGSFVPAKSARIPLTDRIFTRVGAQDNIAAGESTFLVEMQEAANILNNATSRSIILLDEVGRGTATFDGISIAWAIAEYLHEVVGAKTLFATHYHELTSLAEHFERIDNVQIEVRESDDGIVFTHRVVPGHSDHSFGIHVARMAGLPRSVITTATAILAQLEGGSAEAGRSARTSLVERLDLERQGQLTMFTVQDDELRDRVRQIDLENMTPLQAFQALADLKERMNDEA